MTVDRASYGCDFVIALPAIENLAELCRPAFQGSNPRAALPGRIVADMLRVSAGKIGYPMRCFVLVKADDLLIHNSLNSKSKGRA
jgi:hypothetical protein